MAQFLSEVPFLMRSLVSSNPKDKLIPLDAKRILTWKCEGCAGTWKESLSKRSSYIKCPMCEPAKGRSAKVAGTNVPEHEVKKLTPKKPQTSAADECPICCLPMSKPVECLMCNYRACVGCTKTYILGGLGEAMCMNTECAKPFSNVFMVKTLTKKWVMKEYKQHMDAVWFDRDRALIPDTMPLLSLQRELRSARGKLARQQKKYDVRYQELHARHPEETEEVYDEQLFNLAHCVKVMENHVRELEAHVYSYPAIPDTSGVVPVKETWIQGCEREGCNGLVNNKMICGACGGNICKECRVAITRGEPHTCLESDVFTVKSLRGNTKPCPSCAAPIYKIDGCDQMWCVGCKTAFSWSSGRIEKYTIHNPHYYEWLRAENRKNGGNGEIARNAGVANECVLWPEEVRLCIREVLLPEQAMECDRIVASVQRTLYRYNDVDATNRLYRLRASYIRGTRSETSWRNDMLPIRRYNALCKRSNEIYDTYCLAMRENIASFVTDIRGCMTNKDDRTGTENAFRVFFGKALEIKQYFNDVLINENSDYTYDNILVLGLDWDPIDYRSLRAANTK